MNRTTRKALIFICSALLVVALVFIGLILTNRDIQADSGNRYIAYIDSTDHSSATFKGITDVNLMILKVSADGTISSALPGKSVTEAMALASAFKDAHPNLRVNICVLGVDGWESFVESSAYVSRINQFSAQLFNLTEDAGLDGIDLYIAGPTSVNFANLCKALYNLMNGQKTSDGEDYTLSLSLCSDGNSLELTSSDMLKNHVDYFNIMCFDYGTEATGEMISDSIYTYLDYGLGAANMNLILSSTEVNAELAADVASMAYANGLDGMGIVGYSSDQAVSQMTAIMIYVFENGINIIVEGDMAAFPMKDLGEYDRDQIIVVCTIGDDIFPVTLSKFNAPDNTLYYHVMYDQGFFSAYFVNISFGDILGTQYCDAIQFCCARGLFDVNGDGFFYIDRPVTNQEAIADICRITTEAYTLDLDITYLPVEPTATPEVTATPETTLDTTADVTTGSDNVTATPAPQIDKAAYYAPFITWAVEKGILSSDSNMVTNPSANITREDMVLLLNSLAAYMNNTTYSPGEWIGSSNPSVPRGEAATIYREYIDSFFAE